MSENISAGVVDPQHAVDHITANPSHHVVTVSYGLVCSTCNMVLATDEDEVDEVDVPYTLKGFVIVTSEQARDPKAIAAAVRARLLEVLPEGAEDYEDDAELATRLEVPAPEPEQSTAEKMRAAIESWAAELAQPVHILGLNFGSERWDNGVFLESHPGLILEDGRQLDWWQVFPPDQSRRSLSTFTADLAEELGIDTESGETLLLNLNTLQPAEDIADLFADHPEEGEDNLDDLYGNLEQAGVVGPQQGAGDAATT